MSDLSTWLTGLAFSEGKKYVRKATAKENYAHQFAHWAVTGALPPAKQPKAKALVSEIAATHAMMDTKAGMGVALVKTLTNATMYPAETIQAMLNYAYKNLAEGTPPPTVKTDAVVASDPLNDLAEWGWYFGMEWMGAKIARMALATPPAMISYYSVFKGLPFTDQAMAKEVKLLINSVQNKLERKYKDEGVVLEEPLVRDIATKLIVFAYMYPMETAQGLLDYATENITSLTFEAIEEKKSGDVEKDLVTMPGAWKGGRRGRLLQKFTRGKKRRGRSRQTFKQNSLRYANG